MFETKQLPKKEVLPIEGPTKNPFLPHFLEDARKGEYQPIDPEAVSTFFEKILEGPALTPLSEERKKTLFLTLNKFFQSLQSLKNGKYRSLIESPLVYGAKEDGTRLFYGQNSSPSYRESGVQYSPLTQEEKVNLLSDPEVWQEGRFSNQPLKSAGSRPLFVEDPEKEDGYHDYTKKDVLTLLQDIRKRTGKSKLKILDVGGNLGFALYQAKQLDSNIETYNMTLDLPPIGYPVDHLDVRPAEIFPQEYEEEMDVIISNFAFSYFMYPDTALENCLKALSIGGEGRISLSTADNPLRENDDNKGKIKEIVQNMETILKRYEEEGYIEVTRDITDQSQFSETLFKGRRVIIKIVKKKPIPKN